MNRTLLGFLILGLLSAPSASAASASFVDEAFTIPYNGSYDLPVTITVECGDILGASGSYNVPVSVEGLPDYFGAGTATAEFAASDCLVADAITKDVVLTFTPTQAAFGLDPYPFQIKAGDDSFEHKQLAQVGYKSGHSLTLDQTFPHNLTTEDNGKLHWNVTVEIDANSQTMVMFQNLQVSVGKLSGINHQIFNVEEGDTVRTLSATFEAPDFEWEEATIQFWNYSHCLKGVDCPPINSQNMTWVITNDAKGGAAGGGSDAGNDSPAVAPIGLGLVLVAAALIVRRQKA